MESMGVREVRMQCVRVLKVRQVEEGHNNDMIACTMMNDIRPLCSFGGKDWSYVGLRGVFFEGCVLFFSGIFFRSFRLLSCTSSRLHTD